MDRKKELKQAYKETPTPMGVYQIRNEQSGKTFVGSHMNVPGKLNSHRFTLTHGSHINKELQRDWNTCGADAFSFEVLETINPDKIPQDEWKTSVAALEEKWLDKLHPYGENGYNTEKAEK